MPSCWISPFPRHRAMAAYEPIKTENSILILETLDHQNYIIKYDSISSRTTDTTKQDLLSIFRLSENTKVPTSINITNIKSYTKELLKILSRKNAKVTLCSYGQKWYVLSSCAFVYRRLNSICIWITFPWHEEVFIQRRITVQIQESPPQVQIEQSFTLLAQKVLLSLVNLRILWWYTLN